MWVFLRMESWSPLASLGLSSIPHGVPGHAQGHLLKLAMGGADVSWALGTGWGPWLEPRTYGQKGCGRYRPQGGP